MNDMSFKATRLNKAEGLYRNVLKLNNHFFDINRLWFELTEFGNQNKYVLNNLIEYGYYDNVSAIEMIKSLKELKEML